jgi:hypothetical protein
MKRMYNNSKPEFEPILYSSMDDSIMQSIGEESIEEDDNDDEEFSGFRLFGIGKETDKQKARKAKIKEKLKGAKDKLKGVKDKIDNKLKDTKNKLDDKLKGIKGKLDTKLKEERAKIKKVATSIKNKIGEFGKKFRNAFRKVMRTQVLKMIEKNTHGMAVRLYPAIATDAQISQRKFKKTFAQKSKNAYSKLLSKWKDIGGTEDELRSAIEKGHGKRRFAKNPYKSFDGKNNSDAFYKYLSADGENEDNGVLYSYLNYSADGEEEEVIEEAVPQEEEKQSGIKAFFAWIKNLFNKNKGGSEDESPYEEGTEEAAEYAQDVKEDIGNEPVVTEADNEILNTVIGTAKDDDAGGETDESKRESSDEDSEDDEDDSEDDTKDKKFLGMPKAIGITVVSVAAVGLLSLGAYLIFRKK